MRRLFQILLGLSLLGPTIATATAEELLKVAVPQRGSWDAGIPELGLRGGIFKKHGLQLEILYTSAGPESIQALIAGGVAIAPAPGVSAAFGTFAKGAPIRLIGSEIIGSPDLYWYVPANSPIKTIPDFNGRAGAHPLPGSVGPPRLADQDHPGLQRQDGRLLAHRFVEPCRPARADRAVQAHRQADLHRQHHRD